MQFSSLTILSTYLSLAAAAAVADSSVNLGKRANCATPWGNAPINNVLSCITELKGRGSDLCTADPGAQGNYPPQVCRKGQPDALAARVYIASKNGVVQSAPCVEVGDAVERILNECGANGSVQGTDVTTSNPNLAVDLHN